MELTSRVYIAGHQGLVGSAILRRLERAGCQHLITRARSELDLTSQPAVERFFQQESPEYVFLAAAKVGGILANDQIVLSCNLHNGVYICRMAQWQGPFFWSSVKSV